MGVNVRYDRSSLHARDIVPFWHPTWLKIKVNATKMAIVKWTDARKQQYLDALGETGRHECAALAIGMSARYVRKMRDANPSYDEQCADAIENYHAWIYAQIKARIQDGSDRIIEMEAKRIDPAYRDKPLIDVNLNGGGGVIMGVPAKSPEQITLDLKANNSERVDPTTDPDMEILLNET